MVRAAQGRSKRGVAEGLSWGLSWGSSWGLVFLIDGEAVGELGAVVGQDGVDREAVEKALDNKAGGGGGAAIGEDFEIDKAGRAIDRDPSLRWGRL